jgi:hypothetical protein
MRPYATVPAGGWTKPPTGPTIVYVGNPRKDGKQLVTFCYARQIRKLYTPDQVQALLEDDSYQIRSARR